MFKFISEFRTATPETKMFTFTVLAVGSILVITTLLAFLRLDYVRSYDTGPKTENLK